MKYIILLHMTVVSSLNASPVQVLQLKVPTHVNVYNTIKPCILQTNYMYYISSDNDGNLL